MSATRATKSGLAADAQRKIDANYDEDEARRCLYWIRQVAPIEEIPNSMEAINATQDGFYEYLHDGMVLCKLMDTLTPGKVNWKEKTFQVPKIAAMAVMRERERIAMFNKMVVDYGVTDTYTFPTESLNEKGALNLAQVCICIRGLGIEAQNKGVGPDGYWPKKSQAKTREWTDEQKKAGQNVISLQYGTNKGASQAGMNMGKQRKIID